MQEAEHVQTIIDTLKLEKHIEGGYYRRTFSAQHSIIENNLAQNNTQKNQPRCIATSIYYLLTAQSPIGHLHLNTSDIIHYFHSGNPIRYTLINSAGELNHITMGNNIANGEQPQMIVAGGTWKASELIIDNNQDTLAYGLISEAVVPGFDYKDMRLATLQDLATQWPQHQHTLQRLINKD